MKSLKQGELVSLISVSGIPITIKSDYSGVNTFNNEKDALSHLSELPSGVYFEYIVAGSCLARGLLSK